MTTYVIRENCFVYDDSYDAYVGSRIASYFTDRTAAEAEYKRLEIEATRYIVLYNQDSLWNISGETRTKLFNELDDFVFSCCGEHILEDGELKIELPKICKMMIFFNLYNEQGFKNPEFLSWKKNQYFMEFGSIENNIGSSKKGNECIFSL